MKGLLIVMLIISTQFCYSQNTVLKDDPGDIIFNLDIEAITGDNQLLGIEFDGTNLWVTGAGNAADPNYLYQVLILLRDLW